MDAQTDRRKDEQMDIWPVCVISGEMTSKNKTKEEWGKTKQILKKTNITQYIVGEQQNGRRQQRAGEPEEQQERRWRW